MTHALSTIANRTACWRAILLRDPRANFVYGVRSTRIYCRPACPSRRPARDQVEFYRAYNEAEAAGYRACRRCRPNEREDRALAAVARVTRAIDASSGRRADVAALARTEGISQSQLRRDFRRVTGITLRQYAEAARMRRLRERLRSGEGIIGAMYDAGLGSSSRLYERSPGQLGMTPGAYKRGGAGARIRYTLAPSPVGVLLVGATDKGICAVTLGGSERELEAVLEEEFPRATRERDDGALAVWVAAILRHLRGEEPALELPLDVRATAFQRRVWQVLRKIPYGATRSYAEVARSLGQPTAFRAVARACATNPAALVIPCHRVVRTDGGLGGYRWGLDRKRLLLDAERRESERHGPPRQVRVASGVRSRARARRLQTA